MWKLLKVSDKRHVSNGVHRESQSAWNSMIVPPPTVSLRSENIHAD